MYFCLLTIIPCGITMSKVTVRRSRLSILSKQQQNDIISKWYRSGNDGSKVEINNEYIALDFLVF